MRHLLSAFFLSAATACNLTLAPSAESLATGREAVAALLAATQGHLAADYVVCLQPGVHSVAAAAHSLGSAHSVRSGAGRVVWRGLGGGARVSGGAQVTGWAPASLGGGAVYAAAVPPAVPQGSVVRQLWVAGARAARTVLASPAAALGGMALWEGAETVGYVAGKVPAAWLANNTQAIEFVYPIVLQNWVSPRCTVASIELLPPPAAPGTMSGPLPDTSTVSHSGINPGQNVSGQVQYAGDYDTPQACADACAGAPQCTSYTYHDSTCGGGFARQCYWRVDGVWAPEGGWAGHWSGAKASSTGGANITLAAPCGGFLATHGRATPQSVEAAPAFPLAPGVFYHDAAASTLYYALAPNQTAADLAGDAWVAAAEVLLDATNASGHVYQGLAFEYGAWRQVNTPEGYVDTQAAVYACTPGGPNPFCPGAGAGSAGAIALRPGSHARRAGALPMGAAEPRGNVRVSGGSDTAFVGCTFAHLGAAYALSLMEGTQRSVVTNCSFTDLSGGFLKLGSVGVGAAGSADPADWDAFASVTHNTAEDMALEYDGACGYFGGFLFSADVSHNTVSDAGYSGFSQGWGAFCAAQGGGAGGRCCRSLASLAPLLMGAHLFTPLPRFLHTHTLRGRLGHGLPAGRGQQQHHLQPHQQRYGARGFYFRRAAPTLRDLMRPRRSPPSSSSFPVLF